jgi:eukaryotic-like serine/threonine-protein kinase
MMVARAFRCDESRLRSFLDDDLPERELSRLSDHLETCAGCRHTLERLAAGSRLWAELRDLAPASGTRPRAAMPAVDTETFVTPPRALPAAGRDQALDFLAPSDAPGSLGRLGSHEVTDLLGSGGFGIVLKAIDPALGRVVAIKVLAPQLATSAAARSRFAREARAAAAVVHDHVVAIHTVDSWNGLPYLVMPYIAGCSVQERVDRAGPMDVRETLRIGMQTAQGLAAAHAQGLVHRDVKPSNILLENGVERVKLTDFGLARAVDDASLTQSGVVAGTPQYMSPEQARGEPVDHRSDLFSLGSVLYFMCVGRPPFRADSTPAVLRRVCDEQPRPLREVNPEVPLCLAEIVARLQAKDPAQRIPSATEVAAIMGNFLSALQRGLPIEATRSEHVPAPPRRPGRTTTIAAGLSISAVALAVASLETKDTPLYSLFAMVPHPTANAHQAAIGRESGPQVVKESSQDSLIIGSGNAASKTWDVTDFTRLQISSRFHARIGKGTTFKVTTTADDNVLPFVRVSKEGNTLTIGLEPDRIYDLKKPLAAEITLPTLAALDLSGASRASVNGFRSENELTLRISGASKLDGSVAVEKADFQVRGSSTVSLAGSAQTARLAATGASYFKLGEFTLKACAAEISGASIAEINVRSDSPFKAKLAGASRLSGTIQATNLDLELRGASHAKLGGAASDAKINATGGCHLDLAGLAAQTVDVTLSGASTASVTVSDMLRYQIAAASRLTYGGDPSTRGGTKSGGSTLTRKR